MAGIRHRHRYFLLPALVFFIVSVLVDSIDAISLFNMWHEGVPDASSSLTWVQLGLFGLASFSLLHVIILVKILVSVVTARALLQLYRRGQQVYRRSPLRNKVEDSIKKEDMLP
jgi:hypothetical protein